MAEIKKKNILFEHLGGSTRVSAKPDFSERAFSQGQKGRQGRFGLAVAYACEAKTEPF